MPLRSIVLPKRARPLACATLLASFFVSAPPLAAQLIQVKTLPIADGDQWRLFPSANLGIGGLSIALADSLSDPFDNPAKGARLSERGKGLFFGSPTFYSISRNAGGGRTLPLGGIVRHGSTFGGLAVALQEIDPIPAAQAFAPCAACSLVASDGTTLPQIRTPNRQNRFAFATLGHLFSGSGFSIGASALWAGINDVDGVDLLYVGSRSINQSGGALDLKVAALKEWSGGKSFEATVLHNRFSNSHDVTWADPVWDPNTRTTAFRGRTDHNMDRTNTWGMHLGYSQPLADSGWRIGAIATTNLMSHPKLPDYQIAQAMVIPWDPGHTAAYNFGIGLSKAKGPTTFGVEAIFEPIHTHTWGESPDSIITNFGVLPAGSKTTENHFFFSNAIIRTGVGRDIPIDTAGALKSLRLEGGIALHSIDYDLDQLDHTTRLQRQDGKSWIEWTRTWGLGFRFSDLLVRYMGRMTTGTGRPGVSQGGSFFGRGDALAASSSVGQNFLSAPTDAGTLTNVSVTTHQFSVSIPIR